MTSRPLFRGAMTALVTPFDREGKVHEEHLKRLIEFQIAGGVDAIVPCGTTGEASTLEYDEHFRVCELTVKFVNKRAKVIIGGGSNNTRRAIELTRFSKEIGADAVLSVGPYYNKPTQEGHYRHFKAIAESTDIPIIIYNIPGRTGTNLLPETLARLAEIKNIVGVKEASGSLKQMSDVIQLCRPDFDVLSGDDIFTLALLAIGGKGVISVISNVVPADMAEMVDVFAAGDLEKARALHYRMAPLIDVLFIETNPIPVKAALAMMGKIEYELRLPLCRMSEKNEGTLKKVMQDYGLIG